MYDLGVTPRAMCSTAEALTAVLRLDFVALLTFEGATGLGTVRAVAVRRVHRQGLSGAIGEEYIKSSVRHRCLLQVTVALNSGGSPRPPLWGCSPLRIKKERSKSP